MAKDYGTQPRPAEATLASEVVRVERKIFTLAAGRNLRGKFLRITEECNGRQNVIIIPADGVNEFLDQADKLAVLLET